MAPSPQIEQVPSGQVDLETPEAKYARLYSQPLGQPPPQPQQAAPVQAPVPPAPAIPTELTEALAAMRSELAEIRSNQPALPPPPAVVPGKIGWVDKIREGDFEGAERALASSLEASMEGRIKEKAYADALAATQVQLEIDRHISKVRVDNPDIARFERYLQAPVNARVEAARSGGQIKSSEDFIRVYKAAVDAEVLELRNLGLQYRADGKTEALTRNQQVMGAFTAPPQQVGDHTSQVSQPGTQSGESNDDYFARRKQSEARLRNLSV